MNFHLTSESPVTAKVDGLILPIVEGWQEEKQHPSYFREVDAALKGELSKRMEETHFKGEAARVFVFNTLGKIGPKAVYVVGMGKTEEFEPVTLLKAYAAASRRAVNDYARKIGILYLENEVLENFFRTSVEGILLGNYTFDEYRSAKDNKSNKKELETVHIHYLDKKNASAIKDELAIAQAYAEGTCLARDLVNRPAIDMYPEVLAKICQQYFKTKPFSVKVWDENEIKRQKMMSFFSVSRGSLRPPRFIHMHYQPSGKVKKHVVLVGKGVTYDTGGLSLKPPRYMIGMKGDMAGAAAVIGTFKALATLRPEHVEIDGIIAATENIIGMDSTKPGDVVFARNGKSIEVLNTDAEGRLTLADALDYACELKNVDEIIDLATLTGAQLVATGDQIAAGMTNNDAMFAKLKWAGERAGEKMWQLPLPKEYKDYIKGDIADIKNMGPEGGTAGSILGGLFLQEFVTCNSWVHMDIAGLAISDRDHQYIPKGASGYGVRTLLNYLAQV